MMRLGRIFVFSATSSISSFFASRACCNFLPTDSTIFTDWFKTCPRRYITAKYPLLHLLFTRAHLSPLESPVASPFTWAQNAPALQDVNYSSSAGIAQP